MKRLALQVVLPAVLLLVATSLQAAPEVQALLDEFSAVNWHERARPQVGNLDDTGWLTRVRIEHALIRQGAAAVLDLVTALDRPNPHVRALAAFCLGAIGDESAIEPLIGHLSADSSATARVHIAEALGRLADPRALPGLEQAAGGGMRWLRDVALLARQRIEDRAPAGNALQTMARPAEEFAGLTIPAVGAQAPDFDLLTHAGERVRLADFRMKKPVVVISALANW
jgi:HEAT repeat protein